MIDLSFLTEEEQDVIMKVLQRDAELKRTEEERVRHLPEKIKDDQQLKNMSGQWFYEAKSKRHRDKIHGADIIRASIRKKKLQTSAEQSQNRTAGGLKTWVNNVNKDMLLSSEPMGVQEEDKGQQSDSRTVVSNPAPLSDEAQENPGKSSLSTTKLRKNPFNNPMVPENTVPFQIPNEPSENGRPGLSQTSQEGALFHSKENKSTPYFPDQRLEEPRPVAQGPEDVSSEKPPIPKARKLINKNKLNQLPNDKESLPKLRDRTDFLNKRNAPRGILKRNSSSSSTDSECFRSHHTLEPRNKNLPAQLVIQEGNSEKDDFLKDESSQNPLEPLKQVRFSAVKEVSQGPELNHGRELGEFGLLESDIPMSGMEDASDLQEPVNKPLFSRYRQPAQQMSPASDTCQTNEISLSQENLYDQKTHPQSEILTERQPFSETSSTERMSKEALSKGLSLESELCKNPADECTHWVEPEPPQVHGISNAADHQQGKHLDFKALNAKTNFQYDQKDTRQRNATNSSISKVLYWFSRSSNPDPEEPSFLHHEGKLSKGKMDSAYQNNNTMDTENAIFQQAPISMKADIKPGKTGPFWMKGDALCFENKNSSIEIKKLDGAVLPKQAGKEKEQQSLSFKSHNQGSKSTIPIQDTKNPNKEIDIDFLNTDSIFFKELDAKSNMSSKGEDSSHKEKLKVFVKGKSKGNSEIDFSESNGECKFKHIMEAKSRRVKKADGLSFSSEGENISSFFNDDGFRENESNFSNYKELSIPCKEPDDLQQQKPSHLSGTQEKREIYKNVSDRISFWEGGRKTAKMNAKMLHSAGDQLQVPARINLPMKSIDLSMKNLSEDQNECGQVIAKKVDLNKNGQTSHAPVIYSSVNHEGFKSQTMNTSREYPSVDHPGKIPSFQNEYSKLPMTDNLQSKRDEKTFSISKPDSHERNETCSHLQNGRSSIAQPNPTFKFWTLKEKMNENFPKQINSPSQFQNLRNFWDVVTNLGSTNNNTHPSSENSLSSDSQRDELDETELTREKSASVGQDLPRQNKTSVGEEITESDSKLIPHSLSDETTFLLISPAKALQLPRNVPSKENVDEYLDLWVPQKLKEEGYFSMEEVKESVIKTNVLPKEYQDNFNRSLKKLLDGAPSLSPQLVGDTDGLGNGQFSENRRYLQEADVTDLEERSESLQQDSKISTAIILDPPEVQCKPFIPSAEKPLKKAPELPDSSSQIRSECVSTTTSSLSKQRRFFEKVMERSYNKSFYENEGGILLEEVRDASNNTVVPSKIKTDGHEISQKALLQEAPASSHSLYQTANLKESFGEETKSFQEMSSYNPPLQDQIKPSQKEISETVEKTVIPKIEFSDYHSTLEKFFREIQEETFNCTRKEREISRKREPEFAEGVAVPTHNQINSAVKMTGESVVPDEKSSQPIDMGLEEPKEEELDTFSIHCHDSSYVDQSLTQPGSISNQHSKVLPQEISEIITENIIQSGASLREFNIGIDKLLREASESSPLKMEVEEIQETIEKSSAPSVVESAFDLGLEKILKEASVTLPTITEEKEALSNKASPPEQEKLSRKMPHLYSRDQEDAKVKIKRKVLKPEGQDPSESVPRKKTCSKISKGSTPYTKAEEKESSSGSDFSDGFVSSNSDSRRSSSCSEESNPVEKNADRKKPSQNLEDIPSETSNQSKVDFLPEDLVRSAEDDQKKDQEQSTNDCISGISTVPSHPDNQFAYPEKIKRMSKSVPTILQDENDDRETDASSESGYQFGRNKKSMSSFTLSSSSGMTSLSSVSGSAVSIYSGDFGDLDIKGSIQFAIDYVDSLMELHVFVAQCKDLAAADVKKQRSDPYVKTYLLPDKGKMGKKKTLVLKKTLNPVYNEILRYKIDKQSLKTQKLHLSVWHRDMFKHNRFLGEVELDLETWDWDNQQNKQLKWYLLNRRMTPIITEAEKRGEMRLALQYVPEPLSGKKLTKTGEVHIWVKECIDLPCLQGNHLNSFVKCIFLPDTSRKSRQKTKTIAKTTNPFFNHAIVYDGFTPEDLKEACAELTVWDHHRLRNQFLGGLRLGFGTGNSYGIEVDWMDSTPAEVSLWERMVNSPNTWVEDILPLRMLLIAKLTK